MSPHDEIPRALRGLHDALLGVGMHFDRMLTTLCVAHDSESGARAARIAAEALAEHEAFASLCREIGDVIELSGDGNVLADVESRIACAQRGWVLNALADTLHARGRRFAAHYLRCTTMLALAASQDTLDALVDEAYALGYEVSEIVRFLVEVSVRDPACAVNVIRAWDRSGDEGAAQLVYESQCGRAA